MTKEGGIVAEKGAGKALVTTLERSGLELAGPTTGERKLPRSLVRRRIANDLAKWTVSSTLTEMRELAIGEAAGKATTFEVTKPIQLMFRYSGVSRETMNRLTGLEARLFMRSDAGPSFASRGFPGLWVVAGPLHYSERTGKDLVVGTLAESEPGQGVLHTVAETGFPRRINSLSGKSRFPRGGS